MKTAADLANKIEEFLTLSALLHLTRSEEQTLLSLDSEEWELWRSRGVPAHAPAPALLVRRLDYALALLRRMVEATPQAAAWGGPRVSRV